MFNLNQTILSTGRNKGLVCDCIRGLEPQDDQLHTGGDGGSIVTQLDRVLQESLPKSGVPKLSCKEFLQCIDRLAACSNVFQLLTLKLCDKFTGQVFSSAPNGHVPVRT